MRHRRRGGFVDQPAGAEAVEGERRVDQMRLARERCAALFQLGVQLELTFHAAAESEPEPAIPPERAYKARERWFRAEQYLQFIETVREITEGNLSPDTDYLRSWIERYGDNMVKKEWR